MIGMWEVIGTAVLVSYVAILVHEGGHAVAAIRMGIPIRELVVGWPVVVWVRRLGLGIFPGAGWVRVDIPDDDHRAAIWSYVAGPLASAVVALPALLWFALHGPVGTPVWVAIWGMIHGLCAAQLLPVPPFDGGMAVLHLLRARGHRISLEAARNAGWCVVVAAHGLLAPAPWRVPVCALLAVLAAWFVYRRRT